METVDVRELKDHLTHYLRSVRKGNVLVVTSHGKAVARLIPVPREGMRLWTSRSRSDSGIW